MRLDGQFRLSMKEHKKEEGRCRLAVPFSMKLDDCVTNDELCFFVHAPFAEYGKSEHPCSKKNHGPRLRHRSRNISNSNVIDLKCPVS